MEKTQKYTEIGSNRSALIEKEIKNDQENVSRDLLTPTIIDGVSCG